MLWMTRPAFDSYFLGEDFIYFGQYRAAGDSFWGGVWSATDNIFFRPVFCAVNLFWMFILPLDPWVHHGRNFIGSVVVVLLLHRVLCRLTSSRYARSAGVALFALSKIHMTNIGYINCNDSIVSLMLILMGFLCWLRYGESQARRDYLAALLFTGLAIFTKDYGLVIISVVGAIVFCHVVPSGQWRNQGRRWVIRLIPLVLLIGGYLMMRLIIVTTMPSSSAVYSPKLLVDQTLHKTTVFLSAIANLSVDTFRTDFAMSGARGLSAWFAHQGPNQARTIRHLECGQYAAFLLLLGATLVSGRRAKWRLLIGGMWIAAYFGPTLLTRNLQMYYMYEPLAGAAVLLAISLDRAGWLVRFLWAPALVLIMLNGNLSNQNSNYHWQFAARGTRQIERPVIKVFRDHPLESMTFLTANPEHWRWALAAGGIGPMVPELLRQPGLVVRFVGYESAATLEGEVDDRNVVIDIDNGMAGYDPADKAPPPRLVALEPDFVLVGVGCNVQAGGESAIAIRAEHAAPDTVLVLGDRRLVTARASETYLTALVPMELVSSPGVHSAYLSSWTGESGRLEWVVGTAEERERRAAERVQPRDKPLRLIRLHPAQTQEGVGFNLQSDGGSAIGIECENALAGTVIVFDGKPLATSYGGESMLTAVVPPVMLARSGEYRVLLRYGRSESNELSFSISGASEP
ncbi:MAG: hypothetical protein B6D36_11980 [Planctomycetes bacterium UTPLA1]|jgi:hypothetical protein|nr:MAG: hypothetical protein B6D36_11980 [Planctomycetes bacterium UTPLA1]